MIKTIIYVLFSMLELTTCAQSEDYKDIDDRYLRRLLLENDSTSLSKFQNFAVQLFIQGSTVDEAFFERLEEKIIGVCLLKDTNQQIVFNVYALEYANVAANWPVTAGSRGIASFYVKCNTDEERLIVKQAVDSYLQENKIPVDNLAYQFCNDYRHAGNAYEPIYKTKNGISAVMPGQEYSLYRKNGNYIIEIVGQTDDTEQENNTPGDYFATHWVAIIVYIIDQTPGTAYDRKF